ncbi:MAG: pilus assembly PilX N-terminal domain-containing protein [Deltaproteobacteria bacterium]|nr:pilus assembly PilX N-terminal domain-containing protein [Deltaproteobacteria bacterium]
MMNKKWRKEEGAIIVVAIFVVLALVVVGSLATMLTTVELDISKNDKMAKEAFFAADAGCPISKEVLKDMILDEGITYSDPKYMDSGIFFDSYIFMNEVRNYYDPVTESDLNDKIADNPDYLPDITAQVAGRDIAIDVDWRHRKSGAGGSLLFAMGYEGIGADRSHGGVKIYYDIYSKGRTTGKTAAGVKAVYLSQ